LKDKEKKNWLIPVMVGAPDMAKVNEMKKYDIGPYLAGLIEGDGYIMTNKKP
jgi:hypothetical protein